MSTTIDQRVVQMEFNNRQFESNAADTINTVEKLKNSLNFTGVSKGLDSVQDSAKRIDMSVLSNGVETVRARFSALQVMAVTALSNITNSAVNAGKRLAASFTIEPIKTGLAEYETQIGAVQTILANTSSKGTTLNQVNAALDELNEYADKTIYNFTQMTRNIGTFTAAGVDLDTSVSAIQGIANLAAVSGSTSQQASTAMYQLSQALAAGKVTLMDWNSVVNAGMGGEVFQNALKQTARDMGIAVDDIIDEYDTFRESLTQGEWLTADVLTSTLGKMTKSGAVEYLAEITEISSDSISELQKLGEASGYNTEEFNKMALSIANGDEAIAKNISETLTMANTAEDAATKVKTFSQLMDTLKETAQSGWTQTWEILIGDFEEAKELWTNVSDVLGGIINASSESRNNLLSGAFSSGWDQLISKGIADEEGYRESIKEIAKEHNVNFEKMIEDTGSFEAALKKGLGDGTISSGMLTDSVTNLANKMRNMTDEERKAAGYTQEHVESIEALESSLKNGSISMEEFTAKMMRPSGRELLIESASNAFKGLMSIIKPIKEAFQEVFPPITSEQLYKIVEGIRDLTAKFTLSDEQAKMLKSTFKGVFSVIFIGVNFIKQLVGGIVKLVKSFSGLGTEVLGVTESIGNWLVDLNESVKNTDIFGKAIDGIVGFLQKGISKFKEFYGYLKEKISFPSLEGLRDLSSKVSDILSKLGDKIKKVYSAITEKIVDVIGDDGMGDVFAVGVDVVNGGLLAGLLLALNKFTGLLSKPIGSIKDVFKPLQGFFATFKGIFIGFNATINKISGVLDALRGCLETYQTKLKADALKQIAIAIAILAGSLLVLSFIDPEKMTNAIVAITALFGDLVASLGLLEKSKIESSGLVKICSAMIAMSVAVLLLASAVKKLSKIDPDRMTGSLLGIFSLIGAMVIASNELSKMGGRSIKGAGQFILLAASIKILASACKDLSTLKWEELSKGLVGVGILLAEIAIFTQMVDGSKITNALGVVILAAALKILASSVKDFGAMSLPEIGKGLVSIAIALGVIAVASRMMPTKILAVGPGLIAVAAGLKIIASAMNDMGGMSWECIGKGLAAMAGSLALITMAMNMMPITMPIIAVGLLAVSAALIVISKALSAMGGMSWEEIGKGLVALGGSLAILSVGLHVMSGTLLGSAALLAAALSLSVFVPVLTALGGMSWGTIGKGLLAIAASFAVLGIAGILLAPVVPAIVGLAIAVALIGAAVATFGAGVSLLAIGLTILATVTAATAASIVAALGIILIGLVDIVKSLILTLGELIVLTCAEINKAAPAIIETVLNLFTVLLSRLADNMETISNSLMTILIALLKSLSGKIGDLVSVSVDLISNLIIALGEKVPDFISSLLEFVLSVINGLADGIRDYAPRFRDAIFNVIDAVIDAVISFVEGSSKIVEIGKKFISGLIDGAKKMITTFIQSAKDIILKVVHALSETRKTFLSTGKELIVNLKNGIVDKASDIKDAAKKLVTDGIEAIKEKINSFKSIGSDLINGLKEGIKGAAKGVVDSVKGVASNAIEGAKKLLGINSPSRKFAELGKFVDLGFVNGLNKYASKVTAATSNVGQSALSGISKAISKATDYVDTGIDTQPTIRPVLDLSDVSRGAGAISNMLGINPSIGVMSRVGSISASMQQNQNGATNSDVVSAIDRLRNDLGNVGGNSYNINGITYDDGSNISDAIQTLVRAAKMERRI